MSGGRVKPGDAPRRDGTDVLPRRAISVEKSSPGVGSHHRARLAYVDRLRVAAAAAVVMVHVSSVGWTAAAPASADWQAANIYGSVSRWCVPIFFMISGVLFLAPNREDSPRKIWNHYILRLFVMYLAWSFAYTLADAVAEHNWSPAYLLQHLWNGYYHLWYLPAMAGVYALIPLLQRIVSVPALTRYALILTGVASILVPTTAMIPILGSHSTDLVDRVAPFLLAGFPFYFILGHFLHESDKELPRWVRPASYVGAILGVVVTIAGTSALSVSKGEGVGSFYGYLTLGVVLTSVGVFLIFRDLGGEAITSPRLATISRWTLPIYLMHPAFIRLLSEFDVSPGLLPTAIGIPLIWVGVLLLCALISAVLVRIPIVNSWLI
ncbi:acyltransferase [Micropruina sp.]|uniref:acyltransferase n=1 Tax=Micropruina sp. TaxID=2737536 RepID=UPI0039E3DF4D